MKGKKSLKGRGGKPQVTEPATAQCPREGPAAW